jgi:hypothetical protein
MSEELKSNRIRIRFFLFADGEQIALIEADTLPKPGDIVEYFTLDGTPHKGKVEHVAHKMDGPGKGLAPVNMMTHVHVKQTS